MEPPVAKAAARFAAAVLLVLAARAAPAQAPVAGGSAPGAVGSAQIAESDAWVRALERASASDDPEVAHSAQSALAEWRARPAPPARRTETPRESGPDARGPRGERPPPRCGPGCCLHGRGARPLGDPRDDFGDERRGPPPPRGPRPDGPPPFPGERGPDARGPVDGPRRPPPPPRFPRDRADEPNTRPLPPRTQET